MPVYKHPSEIVFVKEAKCTAVKDNRECILPASHYSDHSARCLQPYDPKSNKDTTMQWPREDRS